MNAWARFSPLLALVLLAACVGPETPTPVSGPISVVVSGSAAAMPLLADLAQAFQERMPSVTVALETSNSYGGVRRVLDGAVELGAVSVGVSGDLWAAPVALGGIAVIVHPDNPVEDVTLAQLYGIFGGQVWQWADLGTGMPGEIVVVSREEGSGTRLAFEALVMAKDAGGVCRPALAVKDGEVRVQGCKGTPVTPMAMLMPGGEAVVEYVATHPEAIGYVSQGRVSGRVKAVRVEGLLPGRAEVENGGYPLLQPLYIVALREPVGTARQFVDFCLRPEGQAIVAREHVPVRR